MYRDIIEEKMNALLFDESGFKFLQYNISL